MPLTPIPVSTHSAAEDAARNAVNLILRDGQFIAGLRKNGIAAVPERPARQLPTGQVIPGVAARPGITGADFEAALTPENVAVFDALASALGLNDPPAAQS